MSISSAQREIPSAGARCICARAASALPTMGLAAADFRPDGTPALPCGVRLGRALSSATVNPPR